MKSRIQVRSQDAVLAGIRLFKEELNAIKSDAKAQNMSLSAYVRGKLLANHPSIPSQSPASPESQTASEQTFAHSNKANEETAARRSQIDSAAARKFGHEVGCQCIECARYRRMFGKPSANVSPAFAEKKQRKKGEA